MRKNHKIKRESIYVSIKKLKQNLVKKMLVTLLLLTASVFITQAQYTLTDNDVEVTNGIITKCTYDFSVKNIIIPDTLDGQAVKGIDNDNAFTPKIFAKRNIENVILPSGLKTIGENAFYSNNLDSVILPDSIVKIGARAFSGNSFDFDTIVLPNSLKYIGEYAFSMNGIDSITLPTPPDAGFECWIDSDEKTYPADTTIKYVSSLSYRAKIVYILTDDDVVVDSNGVLTECTYDFENGYHDIIIPDTLDGYAVLSIKSSFNGVFAEKKIESLVLPSVIKKIGNYAFKYNSIKSLTLPAGVKSIGDYAFYDNDLDNIDLPNSVTYIGSFGFGWNHIDSITLPLPPNNEYEYWLTGDGKLIKAGTTIKMNMYISYSAKIIHTLTDEEVYVNNGYIDSCFYDFSVKYIIIPDTLDGEKIIGIADGEKINYNKVTGIFAKKGIKEIQLPSNLQHIGDYAFYDNEIDSIVVPENLNYIGSNAFTINSDFAGIILPSPTKEGAVFDNWKDNYDNIYEAGDTVKSFYNRSYTAQFSLNPGTSVISLSGDLSFGSIDNNTTATKILTISNEGNASFTVTSIDLPDGYTANWTSGDIAADANKEVEITFAPTEAKDYNGIIKVNSNATFGLDSINVSGTGVSAPVISLTGDLTFGNTVVNTTVNKTLTIGNTGDAALTITSIDLPDGYTANWTSGEIAVGANKEVEITFTPTEVKDYNGVITVNSNANSGENTISVSGKGIAAVISLSGDLAFGNVKIDSTPERILTIDNTGDAILTITSVDLPDGYTANWTSGEIAAGTNKEVEITFAPTEVKDYNGVITVNSNANSGENTISVSGSGVITDEIIELSNTKIIAYPNPVNNILYIEVEGKQEMEILNVSGKVITKKAIENTVTFDMSSYQKGIYILKLKNNSGESSFMKIIKQ